MMTRAAPTLSIYLGTRFLASLAGVLALFVGLILLFDTIELLRRTAASDDAGLGTLVGLALLKAPQTVQEVLPFAVMLAVMFSLFRMTRHHELMIIRAAGVSVWQILAPSLALAAIIGVISLTMFNPLAATMYASYERLKGGLMRNDLATLDIGESGFWLREVKGTDAAIVHARDVRQDDDTLQLGGVTILITNTKNELVRRIEAEKGELVPGLFRLENAVAMEPGLRPERHAEFFQTTTITLGQVQDSFADPETLSFWDLPAFIRASRAAGFSALPHRLYLQSLMATPVLLCAMVLLAACFFMTTQARLAGWTVRGAAGIATGFLFYFYNQFTYALGLTATLPFMLAAWAPAVTALLLGLAYLFHREDG